MYKRNSIGNIYREKDVNAVVMYKAIESMRKKYHNGKISVCRGCSTIVELE